MCANHACGRGRCAREVAGCRVTMLPSQISATGNRLEYASATVGRQHGNRQHSEATMSAILTNRYPDVRNYIGGTFVDASDRDYLDVTNPSDGSVISRVPL